MGVQTCHALGRALAIVAALQVLPTSGQSSAKPARTSSEVMRSEPKKVLAHDQSAMPMANVHESLHASPKNKVEVSAHGMARRETDEQDVHKSSMPQPSSALLQQTAVGGPGGGDYGHPEWLSSCKTIYLDVGSNRGVQVRKLFEPDRYPGALALEWFDKALGNASFRRMPASESGLCVLGIEANPLHYDELKKLADNYGTRGWNVHFYPVAAGHTEGKVTFGEEKDIPGNNQLGAQVITGETNVPSFVKSRATVRRIDMGAFVNSLPAHTVKLMKMDIEGAEWQVLPRLAEEHALCKDVIGSIYMEVHTGFGDLQFWTGANTKAGITTFVDGLSCAKGKTEFNLFDDETYCNNVDGVDPESFTVSPMLVSSLIATVPCMLGLMCYFASMRLLQDKSKSDSSQETS